MYYGASNICRKKMYENDTMKDRKENGRTHYEVFSVLRGVISFEDRP